MSKISNTELVKSQDEDQDSECENPCTLKDACSTKYSQKTRSKRLRLNDDDFQEIVSSGRKRRFSVKRKQQNRQSAKKCRMRKKQRVVELENYEKDLQKQLEKLRQQNLKAKALLEKQMCGNNTFNSFNVTDRTQAFERLNKIIKSQQDQDLIDQDEINLILDNIKNRIGATGSQRQAKITYIFKQIIHLQFPALHRYLMWTAKEQMNYFGSFASDINWTSSLPSLINLNPEQEDYIKNKKEQFQDHYDIFSKLIKEMKDSKQKLELQSIELESLIEHVRQVLNPIQCAKFLSFIQSNKYMKQMELWTNNNIIRFSEDITPPATDPGVKKRPKPQINDF